MKRPFILVNYNPILDEQAENDRRMAEHFGIAVEDLDEYDSRIGASIRELADSNMEKWGEW